MMSKIHSFTSHTPERESLVECNEPKCNARYPMEGRTRVQDDPADQPFELPRLTSFAFTVVGDAPGILPASRKRLSVFFRHPPKTTTAGGWVASFDATVHTAESTFIH